MTMRTDWQEEFAARFRRHEHELQWLYYELYHGDLHAYDYFTEMLWSIPVRLFGLASEELLLSGTPYVITPVLSVSLYSFFREFSVMKERAGLYCLSLHFSNMFMLRQFAYSWFLFHIYSNINNAGMGISCLLVLLPMLRTWDLDSASDPKRFNTGTMLFLAALVMLTTGIKGPVAIVFVAHLHIHPRSAGLSGVK